jgi:cobalt-zinc-cadmium resistance protein CzcA
MIDRLLEWSLKNRVMVVIASLVLVAGGLLAMSRLPIDAVPDVTNVQVQIFTSSPRPGAGGGREVHHHPGRAGHEWPA